MYHNISWCTDHLQLGAGGGGDPAEADAGDGPGEDVRHDGGVAVGGGEVGVELGTMVKLEF